MKKIIFFPIEIGLAHITRSLAVATELKKRGHDILFAIPQRKKMLAEKTGLKTGEIIEYTNTDEIKFAENLKNESFLLKQVKSELVLIDQFKPDYAVVDFRISALTSCSLRNVPMFFLTGSGGLPYGCYLPNTGFSPFLHSILSPVFQTIIWKMKKRYFNRLAILTKKLGRNLDETTLIKAMIYVVPEAPTYLPALDERLKIHYVGPIFWKGFNSYNPKWLSSIKPNGKTVYISFGGTGFNSQKLIGLSTELVN
ncbi:hypothetical protein HY357_01445, partial [Candidatus Roizmanbacteria bacterium]|nr:hypothetical protein [Candidatus Roizmanbacteria bacterium]